ncbi:homoserine dehydrogenase [Alphaproteobacteria bacterium]|nr:homoserine dehydrogenase [Alphaproteobacteria bacterium]
MAAAHTSTARSELRLGIAGLGTVGVGVLRLLSDNAAELAARAPLDLRVTAVSARDANRDRGVDLSAYAFESDAGALARRDDVDVVVELIGGTTGAGADAVIEGLRAGKAVVTANKALVAERGAELARLIDEHGGALYYEAAVAGGIPAIKGLREGLVANRIVSVAGILNGTCNFILTKMKDEQRAFDDVLAEAQALGYAEADPSFDIDGVDAAHKLAILSAVAFGGVPDFAAIELEGIRGVALADIEMAEEFGFSLKLLGVAKPRASGVGVRQYVAPVLVPLSNPIAGVHDSFNAVVVRGEPVDEVMMRGRGAGEGPTASAVVADIMDFARGINPPLFGALALAGGASATDGAAMGENGGASERRFWRLVVDDRPGVIAEVSQVLSDQALSVEKIVQKDADGSRAHVFILTHAAPRAKADGVAQALGALNCMIEAPAVYSVEAL